jgi:hypothetical protein
VLPASLLFLSDRGGSAQIWRLEADGVTLHQATDTALPVTAFDTSPSDGRIAYVSDNDLFIAKPDGSNPTLLYDGPPTPAEDANDHINLELTNPRWSPDGTQTAFGLNGVNVIPANGGPVAILLPSDPMPQPPNYEASGPVRFYRPEAWSPDGQRILVEFAYFPEAGGMGVLDIANRGFIQINSPDGIACCEPSWSLDSLSVYYSSPYFGMISAGLWRADALTGQSVTLIPGTASGVFSMPGWTRQARDGKLYFFFTLQNAFPEGDLPLAMYRSEPDGVTGRTPLRSDGFIIGEVLWAADGSGAVIVDWTAAAATNIHPRTGQLLFLKADNSPAVRLVYNGTMLRWGK